jgi:xylulokinase
LGLVLGVDSSTQSTKVEVRDADDGRLIASGRGGHTIPAPPRSEQEPGHWLLALEQALARAGAPFPDVAAVSIAAQQHGLVALDRDGALIRPAKLWNDTESAPESAELIERLGAAGWAAACGSVPLPAVTITKLAWLKDHEPDRFARLARVLLPHDWLTYALTGEATTDRGDASGTGYWSPAEERWRTDLLALVDDRIDWAAMLPAVRGPVEAAGPLLDEAADVLGLPSGVVVGPGTGDNMAAALGLALQPGDVVVSIGTSGTVYAESTTPTADVTGAVAGFADATGRYLPLVCTMNATRVTDAFARIFGLTIADLSTVALRTPAGSHGVVLVPYFDGERTPNRPDATGTLTGLRTDVARDDLARAAFEGVICGLLDGLDALASAGVPTGGRLIMAGGGAHVPAYPQVLADLAGRPVVVPDLQEHVAAGACVQAAAVLHGRPLSDVASAWGLGGGMVVEPENGVDAAAIRHAYAKARDDR